MAREIEIKLRLEDCGVLRERLTALGAACQGLEHETNAIFDTPDGRLRTAGCGLRVRMAQPIQADSASSTTLTFKGPRAPGPIRDREELETRVEDAGATIKILERLGFHRRIVYEKKRETWTLADAEITIDHLPRLGFFAEIEAGSPEAVEALRRQLGFSNDAIVPQSYVELAATHGTERDGVRWLRFGDKEATDDTDEHSAGCARNPRVC